MKYKTTKKAVMAGYADKISVGYCDLQSLLYMESPVAYTARREGWSADIYAFGDTAIVTGYAPFGNVRPSYDLIRMYEKESESIRFNYDLDHDTKRALLRTLLARFVAEVTA